MSILWNSIVKITTKDRGHYTKADRHKNYTHSYNSEDTMMEFLSN